MASLIHMGWAVVFSASGVLLVVLVVSVSVVDSSLTDVAVGKAGAISDPAGWSAAGVAQGPGLTPGPQKAVNQTLRGPQMTITLRGSSQARGPMVPVATAIRAVPGAEARESGKGQ